MSVDQLPTRRAATVSGDATLVRYDQYIETQIRNTRRTVKLVDLSTAIVLLSTSVLAFLLTVALVEHWLLPGGFSVFVRTLLFIALAAGSGYFAYRRLWPLCSHAINPVYAARTIEQSSPSLKNTLVNLLLFRQKRGEVSDAVYRTLEEQAAQRLTRVPVDAAVDRSHLIRLGYVLVGVVAMAAVYKVLSPKDPIITAERVLMPWADIVPASRVRISAVTPGDVTIARGEFIDVAAEVRGIGDDDPVVLRYTTADGQAVDKAIPMTASAGGLKFECRLPAAADATGALGVGQNLSYRILAGDARSLDFRVVVVAAPAILVQRIDYDYPDYTGQANRSVTGRGDVRAIEGTRVTIHARANGPIGDAHVDFDADGRRDVPMTFEGADAKASFVLALRDDRQTPKFANYVLRFTNAEGRTNRDPVKYPIEVLRDYDPEVSLIAPQEKTLDVRLDQTVMIEVDARDPDFSLSAVRLHGAAVGRPEIDVPLLAKERPGPFTGRYPFTPKEHQLRAGDLVQYWATASDNRTPTPNTASTERRTFRIVSSDLAQQPPPNRGGDRGARRQQPGQNQQQEKQQPNDSQKSDGNQDQGATGDPASAGGQRGQSRTEPQPGQKDKPDPSNGKQEQNNDSSAKNEKANPGEKGQSGGEPKSGQQGQPDQQSQNKDQQSQNKQPDSNNQGEQTGAGAAGGASSKEGARPSGARPDTSGASQPSDGGGQKNSEPQSSPVSPKGDHDADAFHRIQDHLEQTGQIKKENPPNSAPESPNSQGQRGGPNSANGKNQQNDPTSAQPNQQQPGARGQNGDRRGGAEKQPGDPSKVGQQPAEPREGPKSDGGKESSSNDPSGKGDQPGQDQRVRGPQPNSNAEKKWDQTPSTDKSDKQDPGATGRRDPNSTGDQGGDLPEGSKDSVTNKPVKREGAGETGQSQSAEKGAGQSGERGAGNDSSSKGRDVTAKEQTGQPSSQTPGKGSTTREGQGEEPGGKANDSQQDANKGGAQQSKDGEATAADGQSGKQDSASRGQDPSTRGAQRGAKGQDGDGAKSDRAGEGAKDSTKEGKGGASPRGNESKTANENQNVNQNGSPVGAPTGRGGDRGTVGQSPRTDEEEASADAANLEYARKQTDLVLEKLSEQFRRKQVDEGLLKKLGWSEDDLRKFLARWNERKEAAKNADANGGDARRELDDALRSLGLRSGQLRQSQVKDDNRRDLQQGYRGAVPLEYQKRLQEYNDGVSRAQRDGK